MAAFEDGAFEDIVVADADGVVADADGVVVVTLNRPEALNAYTTRMCEELALALDAFGRTDEQRVLVLTGAGRGFCSGGDLTAGSEHGKATTRQLGHAVVMREGMHQVMRRLHALDKPTIAMVNGAAVAGGLALALTCDFRIAAGTAVLGDPSGTAGLLPDEGGAWLFPRFMGLDAALKMVLLGEKYGAEQARSLGLVTEVVPEAQLREHTLGFARQLAARAPLAVRLAKRMMRNGLSTTFEQSLAEAELAVMVTNDSDDVREGVAAFRERRPPVFRGR